MDRLNEEGIERHRLAWAMLRRDYVQQARRINKCLLCKRAPVNAAGLCEGCYTVLTDDELRIAERWLSGSLP